MSQMGHKVFHMDHTTSQASRYLGRVVKDDLKSFDLSQRATADSTGIPHVTLSRRLNGSSPFTIDELDRIATLLGTTPSKLMGRAELLAKASA